MGWGEGCRWGIENCLEKEGGARFVELIFLEKKSVEVREFTFVQAVPSAVWTVVHNLNKYPSVSIVNSSNNLGYGEVDYISLNALTITFSAAFAGKAFLN
jgi:hypothetical protein